MIEHFKKIYEETQKIGDESLISFYYYEDTKQLGAHVNKSYFEAVEFKIRKRKSFDYPYEVFIQDKNVRIFSLLTKNEMKALKRRESQDEVDILDAIEMQRQEFDLKYALEKEK